MGSQDCTKTGGKEILGILYLKSLGKLSIFCKFERNPLLAKLSYFCQISAFIQLSRKARKMAKFKQNNSNNKRNEVVSKIKKRTMGNSKIGDARNILHAKSRKQMLATDARDKLAKLAKGTDA